MNAKRIFLLESIRRKSYVAMYVVHCVLHMCLARHVDNTVLMIAFTVVIYLLHQLVRQLMSRARLVSSRELRQCIEEDLAVFRTIFFIHLTELKRKIEWDGLFALRYRMALERMVPRYCAEATIRASIMVGLPALTLIELWR
jgi:hypothetical protein